MAQIVGYFENNVKYEEGPFVLVNINGWRIEVELKGHRCPVLPDTSIYELCKVHGKLRHKTDNFEVAKSTCDWLNGLVCNGDIVLRENGWIWPVVGTYKNLGKTRNVS